MLRRSVSNRGSVHISTNCCMSTEPPIAGLPQDYIELPSNRDFLYPWIQYEYNQADYEVMNYIYLINQTEDINLGWIHKVKFGLETNDITLGQSLGYHLKSQSTKGLLWGSSMLLFGVDLDSTIDVGESDYFNLSGTVEYFQRMSELFGIYGKFSDVTSH